MLMLPQQRTQDLATFDYFGERKNELEEARGRESGKKGRKRNKARKNESTKS